MNNAAVLGPQRAGTRIVTKILAKKTGMKYVDELSFKAHDEETFMKILKEENNVIVQAPGMSHLAHKLPEHTKVYYVIRNTKDILASQERINWPNSENIREKNKLLKEFPKKNHYVNSCEMKYACWEEQKKLIKNYEEIIYESLSEEELFVNKNERKDFKWNQTKK